VTDVEEGERSHARGADEVERPDRNVAGMEADDERHATAAGRPADDLTAEQEGQVQVDHLVPGRLREAAEQWHIADPQSCRQPPQA
jgi:hypothetical protein